MKRPLPEVVLAANVAELMRTSESAGTQYKLARRSNVAQSSISRILRAETRTKVSTIDAIARVFGVTTAELMTPSGDDLNMATLTSATQCIQLINYVQAGNWSEAVDNFQSGDGSSWLLTDQVISDNSFALEIKGDSMLPDFRPGDRVIIDPAVQPNPGDFVVAKNGEHEATFKKYRPRGANERGEQVIELVPLNEDYPTLRSDISPLHIIGTMMEHRRYRKK